MVTVMGSALRGTAAVTGVAVLLGVLAASAGARTGQDSMTAARELYAGAAYRDAIGMLDRLAAAVTTDRDRAVVDQYRALCLLGLNRPEEAAAAAEAMVRHDPLYMPAEDDLSPRTRRLFIEARQRTLPAVAQERYERAKAAYQSGRPQEALALFDGVLALLDAADATGGTSSRLADLRVLASGFRDLASAAVQSEADAALDATTRPATPRFAGRAPGQAAAPSGGSPAPGNGVLPQPPRPATVTPPETLRQDVPPWPQDVPFPDPAVAIIEVVIGPDGRVLEARLQRPMHPRYDQLLLAAARAWAYRPARRDGWPTPFVKAVRIELSRER
jgi:TonB family protein